MRFLTFLLNQIGPLFPYLLTATHSKTYLARDGSQLANWKTIFLSIFYFCLLAKSYILQFVAVILTDFKWLFHQRPQTEQKWPDQPKTLDRHTLNEAVQQFTRTANQYLLGTVLFLAKNVAIFSFSNRFILFLIYTCIWMADRATSECLDLDVRVCESFSTMLLWFPTVNLQAASSGTCGKVPQPTEPQLNLPEFCNQSNWIAHCPADIALLSLFVNAFQECSICA